MGSTIRFQIVGLEKRFSSVLSPVRGPVMALARALLTERLPFISVANAKQLPVAEGADRGVQAEGTVENGWFSVVVDPI